MSTQEIISADEYTFETEPHQEKEVVEELIKASDFTPAINGNTVEFLVQKLPHYGKLPDLPIATTGSIGIDLYAAINEPIHLNTVGRRALIPTGISIELPERFEAQIRPRSGLALKHGLTVLNTPGTIDSDYRGEIGVILINLSTDKYVIKRGDRIAQMIIAGPYYRPVIHYVSELSDTSRGSGGFGHSGTK